MTSRIRAGIPALVVAVWMATAASHVVRAQVATGTIGGVVKDTTGSVIPGAQVDVTNEQSGATLSAVTDAEGRYRIEPLTPGSYRVEFVLSGFESVIRQAVALTAAQTVAIDATLAPARFTEGVVVTARRVEEVAQEVPIPLSVVTGSQAENAGAFNVNRLKDMIPAVQFYSSNPRNSAVNIRGLGAPFGLTNDGLEQGVGLYIDGVYFARPAAATLDFLDVDRIEVLRGPQGTLFGKNTTAGALNVTTRRPGFTRQAQFELNFGDIGFVQAKGSVTAPISKTVTTRLSFSGTERDGTIFNVKTGRDVNNQNNIGVRGQVLIAPSERVAIVWTTDHTRQRPEGYTQVVAGVAPTLRAANRQYAAIAKDLDYTPPSFNAFDRLTDVDSPLRSYQDLGGSSLNVDATIGKGRLTSTSAWRYWNWNPSNDRDFIGLPVTTVSAAPSTQRQWTQEVRYAGDLTPQANYVVGFFGFYQTINSDPSFKQEQGAAAARFLLAPGANPSTPGLLDGYGYNQFVKYSNTSAALFGQIEWSITERLRVLPGLRLNYDRKKVDFDQQVYGGLQTTNAALIALQQSVLAPQAYKANVADTNLSGQATVAYRIAERVNAFGTFATSFKSVGLNLNGVPTDANNRPVISAATVKPEDVHHVEFGVKTEPVRGVTANLTVYDTEIKNFQTQVTNASVGVLRGYLANAKKVRVRGAEFDGNARLGRDLSLYGSIAYTDGIYVSFPDAPPPLEETGGPQVKDVSGSVLPGISKWGVSLGGEYAHPLKLVGEAGSWFAGSDVSYRSSFSSSASYSKYLVVDGYSTLNTRIGYRANRGWSVFFWTRNLLDKDYFELLTAAPGNTGLFVGQPGDPRTFGITTRIEFR